MPPSKFERQLVLIWWCICADLRGVSCLQSQLRALNWCRTVTPCTRPQTVPKIDVVVMRQAEKLGMQQFMSTDNTIANE